MDQAIGVPHSDRASERDLLRFITCGSVDDGKSTLIGRLLHDSRQLAEDQLSSLLRDSARYGTTGAEPDFALLTDGLESEREQGVTIDVAYRFFSTEKRAFIVGDAPGHEQYTRNMATGASTAELAVLLVDARKGVLVQTKRHSLICSLLGIRHIVLAINKMDLVDFASGVFGRIVADYRNFAASLGFETIMAIPISARFGDNVTERSIKSSWYAGPALLPYLEEVDVVGPAAERPFRFPVQWVNRANLDFRGYAGTVASGRVCVGDSITAATTGHGTRVKQILSCEESILSAEAGDAILLTLADEIDIGRGEILSSPEAMPIVSDQFSAHVIWMDSDPLIPSRSYFARIGTRTVTATITAIRYRIDPNTQAHLAGDTLGLNDIAVCHVATGARVAFDPYTENRKTGCFILIDRYTNRTVGAGMITFALRRGANVPWQNLLVSKAERAALKSQRPAILWFTGLSGAGKSTIANLVEQRLHTDGYHTMLLDGDNLRHGLNRDLGFTQVDRAENIRRAGEVAKLMTEGGLIVLCSFISPYRAERDMVRHFVPEDGFIEIFVDTPIEECIRRDPKGLYAKAKAGTIKNFTGFDAPYEVPISPEIHLSTSIERAEDLAERVVSELRKRQIISRA